MANTIELSKLIQEIIQYCEQYKIKIQIANHSSDSPFKPFDELTKCGKQLVSDVDKLLSYTNSGNISSSSDSSSSSSSQTSMQEIADLKKQINENLITFLAYVCYIETLYNKKASIIGDNAWSYAYDHNLPTSGISETVGASIFGQVSNMIEMKNMIAKIVRILEEFLDNKDHFNQEYNHDISISFDRKLSEIIGQENDPDRYRVGYFVDSSEWLLFVVRAINQLEWEDSSRPTFPSFGSSNTFFLSQPKTKPDSGTSTSSNPNGQNRESSARYNQRGTCNLF